MVRPERGYRVKLELVYGKLVQELNGLGMRVVSVTADAPKRAQLRQITQFNGKRGELSQPVYVLISKQFSRVKVIYANVKKFEEGVPKSAAKSEGGQFLGLTCFIALLCDNIFWFILVFHFELHHVFSTQVRMTRPEGGVRPICEFSVGV